MQGILAGMRVVEGSAFVAAPLGGMTLARLGADVATIPPNVLWSLFDHPLTDKGLAAFLSDWEKTGQSIL